ncbi:hypothetical protein SGFS_012680 [Streptomyces graminofaciens]|uniref:Uncharacterized protein n=1 Tax=Streptomyces graminofaciens TaxID=68212 RepID=A0ABN5V9N6_9ACTN|nr:hypothetical protein SGFS_012680 [Streptomyces graminofaciens]
MSDTPPEEPRKDWMEIWYERGAQVARHRVAEGEVPPASRPVVASLAQFREGARRPVEAWPVGEYVLSSRRRVVSGGR